MVLEDLEKEKEAELRSILDAWKAQVATKPAIFFYEEGKEYPPEEYFSYDGFFPGYFAQKTKVLFVGREPRWARYSNHDFRDGYIDFFKNGNVNGHAFWRNVLRILYGIQHEGKIPLADVPSADEIAKQMVSSNDFGFAVMQLSKYSNDADGGANRNIDVMNRFMEDSELDKRNFFWEELNLLEPDVIITANIWDCGVSEEHIEQCFPSENFKNWETYGQNIANYGDFKLNGKTAKLINTYHFAAWTKPSEEYFYNPVMEILFPKE